MAAGCYDPYAAAALESECDRVRYTQEGGRNHQLNTSAFNMASLIEAGRIGEDFVVEALTSAAQDAGLDHDEIGPSIVSGFRGARRKVGAREVPDLGSFVEVDGEEFSLGDDADDGLGGAPDDPRERLIAQELAKLQIRAEAKRRFDEHQATADIELWGDMPPVDGGSFLFDDAAVSRVLWGREDQILWSEGEALMIVGSSGLGKTTLAGLVLRCQLGLAEHVLGLPVLEAQGRILYLAMDRPRQIRKSLLRQLQPNDREVVADRLIVRSGPPLADILTRPSLITEMAQDVGASTVYIDSLKDIAIGLSEDGVGAAYNRTRQHALAHDIQLLELHHMVKRGQNGGIPRELSDVYGSNGLTAGAGTVIALGGKAGDPIIDFALLKQSSGDVGPFQLEVDHERGRINIVEGVNLLQIVADSGQEGATARDVAIALFDVDTPSRGENEKARRRLDSLVDSGRLQRIDGVRGGGQRSQPTRWTMPGIVVETSAEELS